MRWVASATTILAVLVCSVSQPTAYARSALEPSVSGKVISAADRRISQRDDGLTVQPRYHLLTKSDETGVSLKEFLPGGMRFER
jgi:hypothetical protein